MPTVGSDDWQSLPMRERLTSVACKQRKTKDGVKSERERHSALLGRFECAFAMRPGMRLLTGTLLAASLSTEYCAEAGWFGPSEFKHGLAVPEDVQHSSAGPRTVGGGAAGPRISPGRAVVDAQPALVEMPAPIFKYFLGIGNSLSRYWYYRAVARCAAQGLRIEPAKFDWKTKRWFEGSFLRKMRMSVGPGGAARSHCDWFPLAGEFAKFPHTDARFAPMLRAEHARMAEETLAALRAELEPGGNWPPRATGADVVVHLRCGDVVEGHIKGTEYGVPTFGFIASHIPKGARTVSVIGNIRVDKSAARNAQDGDQKADGAGVDGPRRCAAILDALLEFLRARGLTVDFASEKHSSVSEDFALAVQAKHFIGSPSTFSLLAALANRNRSILPATPLFFGCKRCDANCAPELAATNTVVLAANYLSAGEITDGSMSTEQVVDALRSSGLAGGRCAPARQQVAPVRVPIQDLRPYARSNLVAFGEPAGKGVIMQTNCEELYGMSVCSPSLAKVLQYLQLQAPCDLDHNELVNKRKLWNHGIGADLINRQADARLSALQHRKGVAFAVPGVPWIYDRECSERWWECLFRPSSHCRSTDGATLTTRDHSDPSLQHLKPPANAEFMAAADAAHDGTLFRAHTIALTLSPLPDLQKRMRKLKASIGWKAPMIGVHMRHGDIWKEHTVLSTRAYADIVVKAYVATKVPRVFLATDAKTVTAASFLALIKSNAKRQGISLPSAFSVHRQPVHDTGNERARESQSKAQGMGAIADILLLAQSEVLVAMYGSGFGKVASLLGAARYGLRKFAFVDCDKWGGNVPEPPAFSWLANHTFVIPWHGAHCKRKWTVAPPGKSRWAPDNTYATDEWNEKCARNADDCEK